MPNYWESSARPLFVKTVYLNGCRHAILSQTDPLKPVGNQKQSRPNSSLSYASTLSQNSYETFDTFSKFPNDLSSDLQNCLVKLNLTTTSQDDNKCSGEGHKEKKSRMLRKKSSTRTKRKKLNFCKTSKKHDKEKHSVRESIQKNEFSECVNEDIERNKCNLVCDLEDNKSKNYCSIKFSSKSSSLILSPSSENKWCNVQKYFDFNDSVNIDEPKNLFSLHIKNKRKTSKVAQCYNSCYNTDPCETYWNNCLARSYDDSLTEKVIQWIDLAKKQKTNRGKGRETPHKISTENPQQTSHEQTQSIKSVEENEHNKHEKKNQKKLYFQKGLEGTNRKDGFDDSTEMEVGDFVEVFSLVEEIETEISNSFEEPQTSKENFPEQEFQWCAATDEELKNYKNLCLDFIKSKIDSNSHTATNLQISIEKHLQSSNSLNDLLIHSPPKKSNCFDENSFCEKSFDDSLQLKEIVSANNCECETDKKKNCAISNEGVNNRKNQRSKSIEKNETPKKIKVKTSTESTEISENQTLTNENFESNETNSHHCLTQNSNEEILHHVARKNSWQYEKRMGKPQLHIFMPSMPFTDKTEDSISECGSFLSET